MKYETLFEPQCRRSKELRLTVSTFNLTLGTVDGAVQAPPTSDRCRDVT